jgi:predicted exporter
MSPRGIATVGIVCVCLLPLSGCGKKVVPQATVETQVAHQLATQQQQPVPKVVCPDDLDAKVGAKMVCVLTPQGETQTINVTVTVTSITNGKALFSAVVANAPNP